MQKYRADKSTQQADGATLWHANWIGGPTLAKIQHCRLADTTLRRAVYVTGEPDTWFSIPAATRVKGRYIAGYVTTDDDGLYVFRPMNRHKDRLG